MAAAGGRQMSTGGSERPPRARPKVRLVLLPGLLASGYPARHVLTCAAQAAPASAGGTGASHPGGPGRRSHNVGARRGDTAPRLGVHDAEAARRAPVGGAPGREVVLLGRHRAVVLRLL